MNFLFQCLPMNVLSSEALPYNGINFIGKEKILESINQNFELEIGDVVLLIYNQQNIDGQCILCDINSDDKVNVLDVIDLVYIILNQE